MRNVYGEDFYKNDKAMRQVAFAPKLDWSYRPPEGSESDATNCGQYDPEDIMTKRNLVNLLAAPISVMTFSDAVRFPFETHSGVKQACNQLTVERLPTCFYHIIKTLREYPDAPELQSVTEEMLITSLVPENFKFEDTPPALAYLLHDAMRSAYGEYSFDNREQWDQIRFCSRMPWNYKGDETRLTEDCNQVTDEHIIKRWEWVAACRFKENGPWRKGL